MPRRMSRVVTAAAFAGLLAACVGEPQTAAPVIMKGPGDEVAPEVPIAATPLAPPKPPAKRIIVRPGQSLGRIALEHRVSERAIIAASRLKPPYKVEPGQRLLIPVAVAAPTPLAAPPPPPVAASRAPPEVIPLDGPPPPKSAATAPPASGAAKPSSAASAEASRLEPPRAEASTREPALPRGAHFPWPVRGRVLAGYGAAQGGGRNDGINIAAPRGAPVKAVDEGVVAYAGNEVRGYGNLVLVKHSNGFISAYAHCDELLVKRGDKVGRGEVIAKVGATGGVGEPQLHFELRRGKRAVDPREFLAPASNAGTGERGRQG